MGEAFTSVLKVFTEPGKVMAQAASEKRFWIPLTLIVLLTTLLAPFTAPILHKDQISMMEKSPEMVSKIPAERWEEMKAYNAKKAIPMNILRGLFIIPIALLFVAGLTNFAATLSGVEINFSQAFSMTVFSSLVDFFWGALVLNLLALWKGSFFLVATNFTLFAPNLEITSKLFRALSAFDFFNIASYVLLGMGLASLPKGSPKKAFFSVLPVYLIRVAAIVVPAMVFTMK